MRTGLPCPSTDRRTTNELTGDVSRSKRAPRSARTPRRGRRRVMSLAGKWKKTSTTKCADGYPDAIEFFERPRYLASKGPGQAFIWWDAGSYEVTGENEVKISIATDEQVSYRFSISGDLLTFVD